MAFSFKRGERHLFATLVQLNQITFTEANTGWAHICSTGEWEGHSTGYTEFTPAVFDKLIENSLTRATPIDFDYEHDTFNPYATGPRPSAGAIQQLERRGEDLWALVAWTPRAAEMIRGGEYRSCSVVIDLEATDRVTDEPIGPELLSVALTNNPFVDGLQTLQLKRFSTMATAEEDKAAADKAAEKKKADDAEAAKKASATPEKPVAAAVGDQPTDAATTDSAATIAVSALADATGMSSDAVCAAISDNIDKVAGIIRADNTVDGTQADAATMSRANDMTLVKLRATEARVAAMSVQLNALTADIAAREKAAADKLDADAKAAKADADAARQVVIASRVDALIAERFIPKDEPQAREDAIRLFTAEPEAAERLYAMPKVPKGTVSGVDPKLVTSTTVTLTNCTEPEKRVLKKLLAAGATEANAIKKLSDLRAEGRAVI